MESIDNCIHIAFFGDFRSLSPKNIKWSREMTAFLAHNDINVVNFEAPICIGGKNRIAKSGPVICQHEDSADLLIQKGFNIILLANNHMMDYGEEGCLKTINAFRGVTTIGAGTGSLAYKIRTIEVKGKKIGFLSLVQHEFGIVDSSNSEQIGVASLNSLKVSDIISGAHQSMDKLIVCPHAGVEHILAPLPEWREVYRRFIDLGADAVVGSHPHTPQGWEEYNEKPIFYSLGNFFFDLEGYSNREYGKKSLCVELILDKDKIYFEVYNVKSDDDTIDFDHSKEIIEHTDYLNRLLNNYGTYMEYINKMCDEL